MVIGTGLEDGHLSRDAVREILAQGFQGVDVSGARVLVVIPDHTRTAPIPMFFQLFHEVIGGEVAALDYLVALGTHQAMSEEALQQLVGATAEELAGKYAPTQVLNHEWDKPNTFVTVGTITEDETRELSRGLLSQQVEVTVNKMIYDYDLVVICGPVFPHEVVGFSGGNKYFFPGISGPEVINFTHWLGALITSSEVIGTKHTPVRAVINRAAACIDMPKLCFSLVVHGEELAGLYVGTPEEAWEAAADLAAKLHITTVNRRFRRVLSVMPEMYDDIWVAAKGMYKLDPVVEDGGEVIIYAPHITEVSYSHGKLIDEIGYHVRDYFAKQWDRFSSYPWGVLAHSTHVRGLGEYDAETGVESPRIQVTLATSIPRERCERINLGYMDPALIDLGDWQGREDEGILLVPRAGEQLYRLAAE
jgi:nickel-dependent lactate racemase